MLLLGELTNINNLEEIAPFVEGVIIANEIANQELIDKINSLQILAIVEIEQLLPPKDFSVVKEQMLALKDCLFLVTDIGLLEVAIEKQMTERIIYDPKTMITNCVDASLFATYNLAGLGIANEITISDIKKIAQSIKGKAFLQVFGHRLMFQSRRRLLSLFADHENLNLPSKSLKIKEENRQEYFPIEEDIYGTKIYRSYPLNYLDFLNELPIDYAYLSAKFLADDSYLAALKIYHAYLKEQMSKEEAKEGLEKLNLIACDPFNFSDTVYNKEEF